MRRPPGRVDFDVALEAEFRQEQAQRLKVAAEKLVKALEKLRNAKPTDDRDALVEAAGKRAFYFVVQRESMGLTHTQAALDFYKVPGEVRAKL